MVGAKMKNAPHAGAFFVTGIVPELVSFLKRGSAAISGALDHSNSLLVSAR
jgi:hypothetical protein